MKAGERSQVSKKTIVNSRETVNDRDWSKLSIMT